MLRPHFEIVEIGKGRFFMAERLGKVMRSSQSMYFTKLDEALDMADRLNKEVRDGTYTTT